MKKRRYIGVKKAVSQGFYEETFSFQEKRVQSCKECCLLREFKEKKAEEQDRKAVYEENSKKRRFRAAKKAASEENLRRRRLKNKTEKLFMKKIQGKEGSGLQRKLPLKRI